MSKIRNRVRGLPKKLVEEIFPIARFAMLHMSPENDLRIKWIDGTQSFDAQYRDLGYGAKAGRHPKSGFIEVTSAYHPNAHLGRKLMNEGRSFFGLDGLSINLKSRDILSVPTVRTDVSSADRIANIAIRQILQKVSIEYPENTTLLVDVCPGIRFDPHEWDHFEQRIRNETGPNQFHRIYVFENLSDRYFLI